MIDRAQFFLSKAQESLAGAESEFVNSRYNNCVSRCYYACFQAAIAALIREEIQPGGARPWSHDFVQGAFVGHLIGRRKRYSADLRDTLMRNLELRTVGDYREKAVSRTQAERALGRARRFLLAVSEESSR